MTTDHELLTRYVQARDERSFAELVRRYLGLVYAAALRRANGRHAVAEEVAQKVFTDLARKAGSLRDHPALSGWLYRSTRYASIDALRLEQRRENLTRTLAHMPDQSQPCEYPVDWEQVRPVLDAAMDQLNQQDREVMLERFFRGLSFAEVGAKLNLTENAARMRTERALEKLRAHLRRSGITSTATLAALLASPSLVAAPPGLTASVTAAALAAPPAGVGTMFFATFLMNKTALSILSIAFAATMTSLAWSTVGNPVSDADLKKLRAENRRLEEATASGASPALTIAVADEFSVHAITVVKALDQRFQARNDAVVSEFRNCGQATPKDAFLTYCWSLDTSDGAALARILTYDDEGRTAIARLHADLPVAVRVQYPTPEDFVVFLFLAHTLLNPVPGADVAEKFVPTEIGPGRVALRPPGATQGGMNWVQTAEGWRVVVPAGLPANWAGQILGSETLGALNGR